jgi:hypothetical protein
MQRQSMILGTLLLIIFLAVSGCSAPQQATRQDGGASFVNLDTVKAGAFDTGKMWTFDYPPVDYFQRTYQFTPEPDWFEKARLAALRIPGCSASFVSEDGLVMTNHHCARTALDLANREGENLPENGFTASTLADERKIPNFYADQLVLIEDVTEEVIKAFESGANDEERVSNRTRAIAAIEQRYKEQTGLNCNVITFYNGGRYSLYGYKRYNDVRLVFAPEQALGYFGGDYDNFTYPRYDLDVAFLRVYGEDGKPLKTTHFYKWSEDGAQEGEVVFVVGNPGRTSRLLTVAQLEFFRDQSYPFLLSTLDALVQAYSNLIEKYPDRKLQYQTRLFSFSNSQKLFVGRIKGLHDPVMMKKKYDFESTFKAAVAKKPSTATQYAGVWNDIGTLQQEKSRLFHQNQALTYSGIGRSSLIGFASNIVEFAKNAKLPEQERAERMGGMTIDSAKARLARTTIDREADNAVLAWQLNFMKSGLAGKNAEFNKLLDGQSPEQAAQRLLSSTILTDGEKVRALLSKSPDEILASHDPLISFVAKTDGEAQTVRERYNDLLAREQARVQVLGKAVYDVYGTSIPPDATFTLRLADGVVKGYEYNGTIAPVFTTFYGLYDRYYSFEKREPWNLPNRWINPPATFNMATRFNMVSTNDIIGGNSGSPVVNKKLEVVGIAFDGNIESLPNDFIYSDERERCVSLHSSGILEALRNIYKAERLANELRGQKVP